MSSLYDIRAELLSLIDKETGEIADMDAFETLQMQEQEKLEGMALWYINLLSDADQYKAEKQKFAEKEAAARKKAESLKAYLQFMLSGKKFNTTRVNVTYRGSDQVVLDDETSIPDEFMRIKTEPDKAAIKEAIASGFEFPWAHIEHKQNIQIK